MNCKEQQQSNAKIKAVRGNTLTLSIPLQDKTWRVVDGVRTAETTDFAPLDTDEVSVVIKSAYKSVTLDAEVSGNIVTVTDNGTLPVGCFGIEINVKRASGDVRRYYNSCELHVVEQTRDAGIEDGTEFDVTTHTLDAAIFEMMRGYSAYEIWLQQGHEGTEQDFLAWLSGEAQINELIAQVYQDLNNYYQKSSVYTKSEIDNMLSEIPKFAIRVVSSLPTSGISLSTIYLVPGSYAEGGNLYTEYIYANGRWEVLGKQNFDLSNYVTMSYLNQLLDIYYTKSAVDALLNGYVQKVVNMGLSTNDFTDILKTKLEGLSNYDDTEVRGLISSIQSQLDTLVSGDATSAIESFNEIVAFLANVDDEQTLSGIVAALNSSIAEKANEDDVYSKSASDEKFATKEEIDGIAIWGDATSSATTANFDAQTDTVWNKAQTLSSEAKAQARTNIDAASTDTFGASGSGHAAGLVPDPGSTQGTSNYLREDGTWATPPDTNTTYVASDFDIKDLTDSTSLKAAWNGKQDALSTQTAYTSKGTATKVPQITTNTLGQVTGITEVDITAGEANKIEKVKVNNRELTITDKSVNIDLSGYALSSAIPTVPTISTDISNDAASDDKTASPKAVKTYVDGKSYTLDNVSDGTTRMLPTKVSELSNDSNFTSNAGTITGITMNTASMGTSGVVDLGTVVTSETSLSKGTTSGNGNAVTDVSVSGHTITLTKGSTFLTSETSLSLGTTSGTGNAVTDISVSGHAITMTKGSTFLTSTDISGKADKSEMSIVAGTGNDADKTTITLKSGTSATVLNNHKALSKTENGSGNVVTDISVSDHAITVTKGSVDVTTKVDKVTSATVGHLASFVSGGGIADSGFKIVTISESDYNTLLNNSTTDANTIYLVTD